MADRCPKCGMPKDLCVCEVLEKEGATKIRIYVTKKKFRKLVTIIEGIDSSQLNSTAKSLKNKLACGGTAKEGKIILQGNHKKKVPELLKKLGYPAESIEVA